MAILQALLLIAIIIMVFVLKGFLFNYYVKGQNAKISKEVLVPLALAGVAFKLVDII